MGELSELLTERVAAHFANATVDGDTVHTGIDDLRIRCEVAGVHAFGRFQSASLYFRIMGGPFGTSPAFASMSGYESSPEDAVIEGACLWTCTIRPLLRVAAGLDAEPGPHDDLEIFEATVHGRRFRVVAQQLGRGMSPPEGMSPGEQLRRVREAMPESLMVRHLVNSPQMPALAADHSYLLGAFTMRLGDSVAAEVKVHGGDWPALAAHLVAPDDLGGYSLRELAVLVPLEPGKLSVTTVQHTLDQIAITRQDPGQAAGWRGWRHHGGRVGAPGELPELADAVAKVPALASFVAEVVGPGAGPGYGFAPVVTEDGVLLADAGCGPGWVAMPDGSVWADARQSAGEFVPVAGSIHAWFAMWLDQAISDAGPWHQWDRGSCACVGILSQLLDAHPDQALTEIVSPGALKTTAGAGGHVPAGELLDPSHACIEVWSRFGVSDVIWAAGHVTGGTSAPGTQVPQQGRPAKRGLFGWLKR